MILECGTFTVMYQDVTYHFWIECTVHRIYKELLLTFSYIVFSLNKVKHVVNMCKFISKIDAYVPESISAYGKKAHISATNFIISMCTYFQNLTVYLIPL